MTESAIQETHAAPEYPPVLVSEVTRMTGGYYCVAGWDMFRRRMVRPLQASGENWQTQHVQSVFGVGHLIDCSPTGRRNAAYPHATEDAPLTRTPSLLARLDESATYALLLPTTVASIRQVFGQPLTEDKFMVDGTKCPSLGGVRIKRQMASFVQDGFGRFRLNVHDSDGVRYALPVTCDVLLRIFSDHDTEPSFGVAEANEWLSTTPSGTEIILRIGLARGWAGRDGTWSPRRCYVQLNGLVGPEDNYHIFAGPPSG